MPEFTSQKIVDLLFRCTYVEGSTTLITRCGLLSWISSRLTMPNSSHVPGNRLRTLARRACETSDKNRVNDWSDGTVKLVVDRLSIPYGE